MIYALGDVTPRVADDAWIAPGAVLIGDVVVGAGASVWFGAVLRGDNERIVIGTGSNVQEGAVLHTDIGFPLVVGADCTIGHKAMLHGCRIEDGALVGMDATVLNGAVIGAGCLVGARALVTEGKAMPGGSLVVGAPARVARELDDAARAGLVASARHYRANAARFRRDLRPL